MPVKFVKLPAKTKGANPAIGSGALGKPAAERRMDLDARKAFDNTIAKAMKSGLNQKQVEDVRFRLNMIRMGFTKEQSISDLPKAEGALAERLVHIAGFARLRQKKR